MLHIADERSKTTQTGISISCLCNTHDIAVIPTLFAHHVKNLKQLEWDPEQPLQTPDENHQGIFIPWQFLDGSVQNFPGTIWIATQRSTQSDHGAVPLSDGARHVAGRSPTTY